MVLMRAIEELPLSAANLLGGPLHEQNENAIHLLGSSSLWALGLLLSQQSHRLLASKPHLVVVASDDEAQNLRQAIHWYDPSVQIFNLPAFDVGIYSNLYPNPKNISARVSWLHHASKAKPGQVFVATIESLLQKTLPPEALIDNHEIYRLGTDLGPRFSKTLDELGYVAVPIVEDVGTYALRGGILDIFSPAHEKPVRVELFGDQIESLRLFDPESQRSDTTIQNFVLLPPRELLFPDELRQEVSQKFRASLENRPVDMAEAEEITRSLVQGHFFHGIDFLLPLFYESLSQPLDHFLSPVNIWTHDPLEVARKSDELWAELKGEYEVSQEQPLLMPYADLYSRFEELKYPEDSSQIHFQKIEVQDSAEEIHAEKIQFRSYNLEEFHRNCTQKGKDVEALAQYVKEKLTEWREVGYKIFACASGQTQAGRLNTLLENADFRTELVGEKDYHWSQWVEAQTQNLDLVHIIPRGAAEGLRLQDEKLIFLRDQDVFGYKKNLKSKETTTKDDHKGQILSFSELREGDFVVHKTHGIGIYEGLEVMDVQGAEAEYIRLKYRDGDKLFMPVYKVGQLQKYSGPSTPRLIDKLGGTGWAKTKTKVKKQIRDIASELLKLYAARSQETRSPFSEPGEEFISFENSFAYTETNDQLKAINEVLLDMTGEKSMDRLVCGDVGFGKTEVAMRAAFKAVQDSRQVAIIAPTTVLTFQHLQNFKKRFKDWPIEIRSLNRFVAKKDVKKTLEEMKSGQVDIVIGTHRLLSKDISFKDLGLLIIDEEQKFGVKHKERIRQLKTTVDTLALSATPIPRTLNLSLVGIRDLSIINTAPQDRLPTRTFVTKFNNDIIKKAVMSEVTRGGQVFFLHNRVQGIELVAEELRALLPDVRIAVAHGQMDEGQLEKTMVRFFNHEVDLLLCTTIIESGMDIPKANTMFINNAQNFGLSQLYQLRGRVGRSKDRAYCYLLVPPERRLDPDAQERLRIIQENTALGSGLKIAQYDLELRGAGDILGDDQSGHINAVGYELYIELLEDAIREQKGEPLKADDIDPEINVKIPALIPDRYIPDIRLRLAYYKELSSVNGEEDIDRIEEDLRDQFGAPPEPVLNLLGLMLIRKYCKDLKIKDLSSGKNVITLSFTENTPIKAEQIIELTTKEPKKFSITPDHRLKIRQETIAWPAIYDELTRLRSSINH